MKILNELPKDNEYVLELKKIEEGEKISIVSDIMFEVMLNNEERIEYASFIIKEILGIKEDIKDKIKLKKTVLEREKANYKGRRVDFVAEIDNKIVNIEMNNNSSVATLIRNIKYATDLFQHGLKRREEYNKEQIIIQINLNNFSYGEGIEIEKFQLVSDKREVTLTNQFLIINIYLPEIRCKYYNKEEINDIEKMLLVMIENSVKEAENIAKGDKLMENYIEKSVEASIDDEIMGVYDKELDDKMIRNGEKHEYFEKGAIEGEKNKAKEMAEKMLENNEPIDKISLYTGLTNEEIKLIQKES